MNHTEHLLSLYKEEYGKLKDEQLKRIGIRENLIYVTLASFGAVASFYFSTKPLPEILLVLPWVSITLAAVYIRNDQKVTAIGSYIQNHLIPKVASLLQISEGEPTMREVFSWETYRTGTKGRLARKLYQLLINTLVFVVPSIIALILFVGQSPIFSSGLWILVAIEMLLVLIILVQLIRHADLSAASDQANSTAEWQEEPVQQAEEDKEH